MKKTVSIAGVVSIILVVLWFLPIPFLPIKVEAGWNNGGEFCGVVYSPECDNIVVKYLSVKEYIKYKNTGRIY